MSIIIFASIHFILIAMSVGIINLLVQPVIKKLVKKLENGNLDRKTSLQIVAIVILSNALVILISAALMKLYIS